LGPLQSRFLQVLGHKTATGFLPDDLVILNGYYTAIRENPMSWRDLYKRWIEQQQGLNNGSQPGIDDLPPPPKPETRP